MSLERIECGFIPLVDCANLAIAREMGFAAEEGVDLVLRRQTSWSNIRDKLALGLIQTAHMLAPMPIAMSLGLSGMAAPVVAPMLLSANGAMIGVSRPLGARIAAARGAAFHSDAADAAAALRGVMEGRPLRIGAPWPFSMHVLLIEYWLGRCGFDLGREVALTIVPPPFMAEALSAGEIDMFCVGEPWGSIAVEDGVGELLLAGSSIWAFAPEKVLGVRSDFAEERPDALDALIRALYRAARWGGEPEHKAAVAELLAEDAYVGRPAELIERSLRGVMTVSPDGDLRRVPRALELWGGAAFFPWRSQAAWIAQRYAKAHGINPVDLARAESTFRPDVLRRALAGVGADLPGASSKVEGAMAEATTAPSVFGSITLGPDRFFDGAVFDPMAR